MSDPQPLTGEPLALDLVNTRPHTADGPLDLLATADGLRSWLALQADRLPGFTAAELSAAADTDLAPVHAARAHVAGAITHVRRGERPPVAALDALNRAQQAAPAVRELSWDGTAVSAAPRRTGSLGTRLAAVLAGAAADLLTDPACAAIRKCEAHDCVMLFVPVNPRRRWCSAARCGNRARVARYYQRHKGTF